MTLGAPVFQDIDGMNDADWPTKNGGVSFVKDQHGFDAPDMNGIDQDLRRAALALGGVTAMLVTCRIKIQSVPTQSQTITGMNVNNSNRQFAIHLQTDGTLLVDAYENGAGLHGCQSISSGVFDDNVNTHISVLMSATRGCRIYKNGIEVAYSKLNGFPSGGSSTPFTMFGGTLGDLTIGVNQQFTASRVKGVVARPKYFLEDASDADILEEFLADEALLTSSGQARRRGMIALGGRPRV